MSVSSVRYVTREMVCRECNTGKGNGMKSFDRLIAIIFVCIVFFIAGSNLYLASMFSDERNREYRVEINRAAADIEAYGWNRVDLSAYPAILGIYPMDGDREKFFHVKEDYVIREVDGELYRIEYTSDINRRDGKKRILWGINLSFTVMAALVFAVLVFVRFKILKPFEKLSEVPYELAKGNLSVPLTESRSRFFGKFVWGMNLLRENIEKGKQQELKLQRDKKTLVLSISHDIKTPLSAIKLYSKALLRGLYPDRERQEEIMENINDKADEIEGYVSEIIRASNEDFLSLSVNDGECLLSAVIEKISAYYSEKLKLVRTEFYVGEYRDCLVRGDEERLVEVLQNILENAIKYGDGKWIRISVTSEEDCCLIRVTNSGEGLAQAELAHIFESFWRGSNAENVRGSGLGLYICRKLMEKMDGSVFADVENGEMCITVAFRKI